MAVHDITKKEAEKVHQEYEKFVQKHPYGTIHQLPLWGEFQVKSGARSKYWLLVMTDDELEKPLAGEKTEGKPADKHNTLIQASALVLKQRLPFGLSWLYIPRGPLMDLKKTEAAHELFTAIQRLAHEEKAVFSRFDPPVTRDGETSWQRFFGDLKAKNAHAHYQPEATLMVDLTPSEDEILKQMKPKGRYNIKVAQKHGVKIRVSDASQKDAEAFYGLLKTTTDRDRFTGHPKKYYETMLKTLGTKAKLYLAEYAPEGSQKLLAAAIVTYFGDTATYYFGASSNENRNVMAPYLLHWKAMLDAKNAGYKTYDFFGIAPEGSHNHPWQSVTEFKLKFGGKRIEYMDAREIVYKPFWYWIMRVAKAVLEKVRPLRFF